MESLSNSWRRMALVFGAPLLTATAYYFSTGLHRIWWLVWLAPLPVLLLSPAVRAWQAFALALAARALAGLNFWSYLHNTVQFPLWLTLVTILVPSFVFAFAVLFFREFLTKKRSWLAALAFPVTIVAAEYLFSLSQGTFNNTGYTQLRNLPVLQLAAITGIWGISFTVNLFASAVAALSFAPANRRMRLAVASTAFFACVLCYGAIRLYHTPPAAEMVRVGLVETHAGNNMFPPNAASTFALMQEYAAQVAPLAARGAQYIVFPEMSALIPDAALPELDAIFEPAAHASHVQILIGIVHLTDHARYNESRLYSASGQVEAVYHKHHPVPTWEAFITPGTNISVLACPRSLGKDLSLQSSVAPQSNGKIGLQICRDMDYPELSRRYAQQQVGLMLVPAWDQGLNVDAAWHGHLSLMRGVEDGFTMVRDAKVGLLTASDDRGRILAEEPTRADGALVTMLATVPIRHDATLYQKWGDWFAWLDLAAFATLIALGLAIRFGVPLP